MKSAVHSNPPPRILIVEDGVIMARDIERRLQSLGYTVTGLASSGDEAVNAVTRGKPDLVLMDVHLKGSIDGIQTAEKIHTLSDVPVVYVTSYSDVATLTRARKTEPFGYVLKPFDERELRSTIEMALYRHEMYRGILDSEQRFRIVADLTSLFAYVVRVLPEGKLRVEWVTDGFTKLTGLSSEALAALEEHVHQDDGKALRQRSQQIAAGKEVVVDYRLRMSGGEYRWIRDSLQPMRSKDAGEIIRVVGAVQDLTAQKAAEELVQQGVRARADWDDEIHGHIAEQTRRVVWFLESRAGSLKAKPESWEEVIAHVQNVLQVHDSTYSSGPVATCPVDRHLQKLASHLFKRFGPSRATYTVEAEPMELDTRVATGVLLVTQELIANALLHAFPNARKGHIKIVLKGSAGKQLRLQVSDDGIGMRKDFDLRKCKGGGLGFVRKLTAGMGGTAELERGTGANYRIVVPL
jgi:PAS domain S-box-containing protein